ncbi:hypothetical protein ACP3WQ_24345, partial [Salmonella enterica]|uniref:hypothetical protein n=1 Tax=Salmonella enterica TaxID=28901 RepID=UPI003CF32090
MVAGGLLPLPAKKHHRQLSFFQVAVGIAGLKRIAKLNGVRPAKRGVTLKASTQRDSGGSQALWFERLAKDIESLLWCGDWAEDG